MSMAVPVNEEYDPDETAEKVLDVLKEEGRANPYLIRDRLDGVRKQYVNNALSDLTTAGWVRQVTRGLYELVDDPREDDEEGRKLSRAKLRARLQDAEDECNDLREELEGCRERLAQAEQAAGGDASGEHRRAVADAHGCLQRALDDLPGSVPGKAAVEDAAANLGQVVSDG